METCTFATSAVALALERAVYAVIHHRPDLFARASRWAMPRRDPVDVLSAMFVGFKAIQGLVFLAWCLVHGDGLSRESADSAPLVAGVMLLGVGQVLNLSVFAQLGRTGVFYGNRLGHAVPWCRGFPFSVVRHPQYVGTVLSIWGFFILMRYPAPDWVALPLLETVYYAIGSHLEQLPATAGLTEGLSLGARAADPRVAQHPE